MKTKSNVKYWTYGVELEYADWDTRNGWEGYERDPEPNICNSNGIAADPRLISYPFGGEINTPPTDTVDEQVDLMTRFLRRYPRATVNYRTGMQVHIRIPGLSKDLKLLKRIQKYVSENYEVFDLVDPLPYPTGEQYPEKEELKAARKRYHWMRMSHFSRIPLNRVEKQLAASTVQEFLEAEVPRSREGKVLWHAQARAAVNLRQLLQTDTIEFRHFPGVVDETELYNSISWCRDYLEAALEGHSATKLFNAYYADVDFPKLDRIYEHWMEKRWKATSISKTKRPEVEANVATILDGEFDDVSERYEWLNPKYQSPNPLGIDCYS